MEDTTAHSHGYTRTQAVENLLDRCRLKVARDVWKTPTRASEHIGRLAFFVLVLRELLRAENRTFARPFSRAEKGDVVRIAAAARRLRNSVRVGVESLLTKRIVTSALRESLLKGNAESGRDPLEILDGVLYLIGGLDELFGKGILRVSGTRQWNAHINDGLSPTFALLWAEITGSPASLGGDSPFVILTNAALATEGIVVDVRSPTRDRRRRQRNRV